MTVTRDLLLGLNFVAIDVETANPYRGSICQVGMARVRDGKIVKVGARLMRPPLGAGGGAFAQRNVEVHGITARAVAGERSFAEQYPWMTGGLGDDLLVAHNAAFDSDAVTKAAAAEGLPVLDNPWLCTFRLAKSMLALPRFTLDAVAKSLGLPDFRHHNAEDDAVTAALILIELAHMNPGVVMGSVQSKRAA